MRTLLLVALGTIVAVLPMAAASATVPPTLVASSGARCALYPAADADGTFHWAQPVTDADAGFLDFVLRRDDPTAAGAPQRVTLPVRVADPAPLQAGLPWSLRIRFAYTWTPDIAGVPEPSHVNLDWAARATVKGVEVASDAGRGTLRSAATSAPLDMPDVRDWRPRLGTPTIPEDIGPATVNDVAIELEFAVAAPTHPVAVGTTGQAVLRFTFDYAAPGEHEHERTTVLSLSQCPMREAKDVQRSSVRTECDATTCRRTHSHGSDVPAGGSTPHEHSTDAKPHEHEAGARPVARSTNAPSPVPVDDWRPWAVTGSIGIAGFTAFRARRPS